MSISVVPTAQDGASDASKRATMTPEARRYWLTGAAALAGLLTLASIAEYMGVLPLLGFWGATFGAGSAPYSVRVVAVDRNGPAWKAGLRPGDVTDLRRYAMLDRYGLLEAPLANRPVTFYITRGSRLFALKGSPDPMASAHVPRPLRISNRTYHGGLLLMCIFAGIIAWRAWRRRDACILSLMLSAFVVGESASGYDLAVAQPWLAAVLQFVWQIAYVLPIALFATFASALAPPLSAARRAAMLCAYVLAAAAAGVGVAVSIGLTFLALDPVGLFTQPQWTLPQDAAYAASLVCVALAYGAARGVEQRFVAWAGWSVGLLFISQVVAAVGEEYATTFGSNVAFQIVGNTGVFLAPIGLTYALLTRRLVDIGFVLNRAAVFTVVSLIIVGCFVVIEYALSEWIRDVNHLTSAAVNIVVALLLGFSIRAIHLRVDRFVDRVFFRKRYEDERALRDFTKEAAYITDAGVLLKRAIRTVQEHTDASSVSIVLAGDPAVDPDDEALVAMRTFHEPVELHKYRTALAGEYAFPMSARGSLLGALCCGLKRGGETYAPDEFTAVTDLARGVGIALDVLHAQGTDPLGAVLETQREILETLRSIQAALLTRDAAAR